MRRGIVIRLAVVATLLLLAGGQSRAAQKLVGFTLTDLGKSFPPVLNREVTSDARGLNEAGVVVGGRGNQHLDGRAVRWNLDGTTTLFDPLSDADPHSNAIDVNNVGQILGHSYSSAGGPIVVWNPDGTRRIVNAPNFTDLPHRMNDAGQVVGVYRPNPARNDERGWLWNDGAFVPLGTFGGPGSIAHGINNAGVVVGAAETPNRNGRAFTFFDGNHNNVADPGEMTQLPDLGISSVAYAINEQGVVSGFVTRPDFTQQATLWKDGVATALANFPGHGSAEAWTTNAMGWTLGHATGGPNAQRVILWVDGQPLDVFGLLPSDTDWSRLFLGWDMNDAGQIIGQGLKVGDTTRYAFLLDPVFEPIVPPDTDPPGNVPLPAGAWAAAAVAAGIVARRRFARDAGRAAAASSRRTA